MASRNNEDETEYTPVADEELLYEQTIRRLRMEINKGKTYDQAWNSLNNIDKHLQGEIGDDFLKILIAERHFGDGYGIDDLALLLDVSYEKIEELRDFMLSDIGTSIHKLRSWPRSDMSH